MLHAPGPVLSVPYPWIDTGPQNFFFSARRISLWYFYVFFPAEPESVTRLTPARQDFVLTSKNTLKNLPASRVHSHRAQLASLASLSAPRARDLIWALRAPFFLDLALRDRSCALRIHLSLFLIIWYWSSNQFYNNITDDVNYTFPQSHWISFWI